jgi:hypothetical protein
VPELADTIIRDLPRLRDTEAISRDSCHGAHSRAPELRAPAITRTPPPLGDTPDLRD